MATRKRLRLEMLPQPDDVTCGPTCLHAVYRSFGDDVSLASLITRIPRVEGGGTASVILGCDALSRGHSADLYSYNLTVFDPTWFPRDASQPADPSLLARKLMEQRDAKADRHPKLAAITPFYLEFLSMGGRIFMHDPTSRLISGLLRRGPVLTGLSSTFLYRSSREWGPNDEPDDIRGEPQGHFVVLCGYDAKKRSVTVADPLEDRPDFRSRTYTVGMARLVGATTLGVLTYDANLLLIEPRSSAGGRVGARRSGLAQGLMRGVGRTGSRAPLGRRTDGAR